MWPTRTICGALEDMRKCYQTYNFQAIASLIEEVQMLANRMEARLENAQQFEQQRNVLRTLTKQIRKLEKQRDELEEKNESTTNS